MLSLLLVVVELTALAGLALLFHRGSRRYGLAPLLAFLAGLAVLSQGTNHRYLVWAEPRIVLNASVIFVPVVFLAVLVLYVIDGATAARQAVVAIIGLSLLVFYAAGFNQLRAAWLGPQSIVSPSEGLRFVLDSGTVLVSIAAFAISLQVVVVGYQFVRNRAPHAALWLGPGVAILGALWVDAAVFSLFYNLPHLTGIGTRLSRDLFGKTAAGLLVWPLAAAYLTRAARRWPDLADREPRPVFEMLFGQFGRIESALKRARVDLRQERDLVARLAETSPVGILRFDRDGRIAFANAQAERVLGMTRRQDGGPGYEVPEWRATGEEGEPIPRGTLPFDRVKQTRQPVYGFRHAIEWAAGRRVMLSVNAAPLLDGAGDFDGIVATVEDVTERRKGELEREALIRKLEQQNAELERFTYTVSHDLKSPLITIRGFLGFLAKAARSGDLARLEDDVRRIEDASGRMERLLNELLELSRLGRKMNPPEDIAFESVVLEAQRLVDGALRAKGVEVVVGESLPLVFGDRTRLVELVQNLLENAAKFMGDTAAPHVEVGGSSRRRRAVARALCEGQRHRSRPSPSREDLRPVRQARSEHRGHGRWPRPREAHRRSARRPHLGGVRGGHEGLMLLLHPPTWRSSDLS